MVHSGKGVLVMRKVKVIQRKDGGKRSFSIPVSVDKVRSDDYYS